MIISTTIIITVSGVCFIELIHNNFQNAEWCNGCNPGNAGIDGVPANVNTEILQRKLKYINNIAHNVVTHVHLTDIYLKYE